MHVTKPLSQSSFPQRIHSYEDMQLKPEIQSHKSNIMEWSTYLIHICQCPPFSESKMKWEVLSLEVRPGHGSVVPSPTDHSSLHWVPDDCWTKSCCHRWHIAKPQSSCHLNSWCRMGGEKLPPSTIRRWPFCYISQSRKMVFWIQSLLLESGEICWGIGLDIGIRKSTNTGHGPEVLYVVNFWSTHVYQGRGLTWSKALFSCMKSTTCLISLIDPAETPAARARRVTRIEETILVGEIGSDQQYLRIPSG
jgi:hypothetical protein